MNKTKFAQVMQRQSAAIMGIVNTTPDSFSDGGLFSKPSMAIEHGLALIEQGADILDIGGESTRPGADPVELQEELDRVIPVVEGLCACSDILISIDTQKPEVMAAAIEAGATMVNDVNGLRAPGAIESVAVAQAPVCIMHRRGNPKSMQRRPSYDNVVQEVIDFFNERLARCESHGISRSNVFLDPGIGFGKRLDHNLDLLAHLETIQNETNCELLIGVSRKSMIEKLLGRPVDKRVAASVGLAVQSVLNGAKIVRVHDVQETFDAVRAVEAVAHKR